MQVFENFSIRWLERKTRSYFKNQFLNVWNGNSGERRNFIRVLISSACLHHHLFALNHYFLNLRAMSIWNYICRLQLYLGIIKKLEKSYPDDLARVSAIFCIVMHEFLINYLVAFCWCGGRDKESKVPSPFAFVDAQPALCALSVSGALILTKSILSGEWKETSALPE